ncbi:hypothetical protein Tco_0915411 [Tanacetum coccineum]
MLEKGMYEIWDRVKEPMEGMKMTKQERESMLYDEFDKVTYELGETIHSYYLRYAKLINDMKMIPVYVPIVVSQQPPTFQPHSGFIAPTFLPTNDPIASLNKAMIFLSSAYSSRFPPTNNQLQTLSNPRTQATIQNVQVMVQNVQGRQSQGYAGSARNNQATGARVVNTIRNAWTNQPRVIRCYNCKGEVHIAKQCTTKKANSLEENYECEDIQLQATTNFKADHVDAYDSDCDDKATENAIFMANMYPVGSINGDTVEPRYDSDILSENDIDLSVIEQMKSQVEEMCMLLPHVLSRKCHKKNNKPYVDASRSKQTEVNNTKKHAVKQNSHKTDNTMLPSTRRVSTTYASGSKLRRNAKNYRI